MRRLSGFPHRAASTSRPRATTFLSWSTTSSSFAAARPRYRAGIRKFSRVCSTALAERAVAEQPAAARRYHLPAVGRCGRRARLSAWSTVDDDLAYLRHIADAWTRPPAHSKRRRGSDRASRGVGQRGRATPRREPHDDPEGSKATRCASDRRERAAARRPNAASTRVPRRRCTTMYSSVA